MTLPVFLLQDRRIFQGLYVINHATVKRSKEPLPWQKLTFLTFPLSYVPIYSLMGCGIYLLTAYYSWLLVCFLLKNKLTRVGTNLSFVQYTVSITIIWTTNKHKTLRGTQRQFSENYLFGRRFAICNFRNICCKISCLPASPRIFEHLKNGIIAYF